MKDSDIFSRLFSLYEGSNMLTRHTPKENFCTEALAGILEMEDLTHDFIKKIVGNQSSTGKYEIKTQVSEHASGEEQCYIDMEIKDKHDKEIYFIEFKVESHENIDMKSGSSQLKKYQSILDKKTNYKVRKLIYCTKYKETKEDSVKQIRWKDIYSFLDSKKENSVMIKGFLSFLENEGIAYRIDNIDFSHKNGQDKNVMKYCLQDAMGVLRRERANTDWTDKKTKDCYEASVQYLNAFVKLGFDLTKAQPQIYVHSTDFGIEDKSRSLDTNNPLKITEDHLIPLLSTLKDELHEKRNELVNYFKSAENDFKKLLVEPSNRSLFIYLYEEDTLKSHKENNFDENTELKRWPKIGFKLTSGKYQFIAIEYNSKKDKYSYGFFHSTEESNKETEESNKETEELAKRLMPGLPLNLNKNWYTKKDNVSFDIAKDSIIEIMQSINKQNKSQVS